ncbi:MAG: hypothetical protein AB7S68_11745 [Polyangiaceae bacterium]
MSCPDIYLGPLEWDGTSSFSRYANPAIGVVSTQMTTGENVQITVNAQNRGTDPSPSTYLELYWSDPSTGFLAMPSRLIGDADIVVPGGVEIPPTPHHGAILTPFYWTVPSSVASVNAGHVCLLARMGNSVAPAPPCTPQTYDSSSPATDPLSAIKNIHVSAPPPPPPAPGGGGGGKKKSMAFAFAATNSLTNTTETQLKIRALHPEQDRDRLLHLVQHLEVDKELRGRKVKFTEPEAVLAVQGRERTIVPRKYWGHRGRVKPDALPQLPDEAYRLGKLGPMTEEEVKRYTMPGARLVEVEKPIDLDLRPGEMVQTIAMVALADREDVAHVVEVEHVTVKGEPIGGLTLIFVPPHSYFDDAKGN